MKTRKRRTAPAPLMLAELALASLETVARRTAMMAQNTCSAAEYQRMVAEKAAAAAQTGLLLMSRRRPSAKALLKPWHKKATANAKRLRKR